MSSGSGSRTLRERLQQLRRRSENIVKKEKHLHQLVSALPTTSVKHKKLSAEDEQTLQDIRSIQHWLHTVTRTRDFVKFRDVVQDVKYRIFDPKAAREARAAALRRSTSASSELSNAEFYDHSMDHDEHDMALWHGGSEDDLHAAVAGREPRLESFQLPDGDPDVPAGVTFVNGRWIGVQNTDEDVDELDNLSDFDDGTFRPEDFTGTQLGEELERSGLEPRSATDAPADIDDLADFDDTEEVGHKAAPAERELYEFVITKPLKHEFVETQRAHDERYGRCFGPTTTTAKILKKRAKVSNSLQLEWMIQMAQLLDESSA